MVIWYLFFRFRLQYWLNIQPHLLHTLCDLHHFNRREFTSFGVHHFNRGSSPTCYDILRNIRNMSIKQECGQRYCGKVTIITGGSRGIGAGCARVFVKHGSKVVIADVKEEAGEKMAEELRATGTGDAMFVRTDVTNEGDVKNLIYVTMEKYGRIDCLLNNAGWHPPPQKIDDISLPEFRQLFDLNVIGYFLTSKYALPHLRETKGNIINNSSLVQQIGQQLSLPYVATKGAVTAMTKALAVDEAPNGVRVNAFSPGCIWTECLGEYVKELGHDDPTPLIDDWGQNQVMGRVGNTEECGLLCLFLAADATFMTGVDTPLSGGAELDFGRKSQIEPLKH